MIDSSFSQVYEGRKLRLLQTGNHGYVVNEALDYYFD
jgi:hypothetical protein